MLLSPTQRDALYRRISEQIGGQPLETIGAWLGESIRNRLTIESTIDGYIRALLRLFEEEGLSTATPLILRLLGLANFQVYPELVQIRGELEARKAQLTGVDPFSIQLLQLGPFLDRVTFRAVLRRFIERGAGPRVLVVNGPPQVGKTYSSCYVSHLNDAFRNILPVWIPADKGLAESYTPDEVAADIVSLAGGDISDLPEKRETERRWAQKLGIWVLSKLNKQGIPFWLLLDGFRGAPPETHTLIHYLAQNIAQALNRTDGRLLLFDYDAKLLGDLRPPCPHELEDLRPLMREDLVDFFQKNLPGQDAAIVERLADETLKRVTVQPTDPDWQPRIARAVQEVMNALR